MSHINIKVLQTGNIEVDEEKKQQRVIFDFNSIARTFVPFHRHTTEWKTRQRVTEALPFIEILFYCFLFPFENYLQQNTTFSFMHTHHKSSVFNGSFT